MTSPPLEGIKVLEFAGLAPGPFAGLMLADAGASVLRVDRTHPRGAGTEDGPGDPLARHKASIKADLKNPLSRALIKNLIPKVDVLIDPFRPGVLDRLGLGPSDLLPLNEGLVYARITGFRRDGRYARMAGHDINYLSVSGVLSLLGRAEHPPTPPSNILADFAGGGAMLVHGILLALLARGRTGRGQVVDVNMVDGTSYLASFPRMILATPRGVYNRGRGRGMLDGGAPYYDTYETRGGGYVAVGALEFRFFRALLDGLGLRGSKWDDDAVRWDPENWPALRTLLEAKFKEKTREEWEAVFDGTDACCTPVLEYEELRNDAGREGEQRAPVRLAETPCHAAADGEGGGYVGNHLPPGRGGEETLKEWLGWRHGVEYEVGEQGALVCKAKRVPSKL